MKSIIKGWWHVITAVTAALWLLASAVFGWVNTVDAFMAAGARLTPAMADSLYVRQDVHGVQQREILRELRRLNLQFRFYVESQGIELPPEVEFDYSGDTDG